MQLEDCDALMWHFSQNSPKDFLFAKQLIYSVEASGKKVFPDFHTAWHFDDKVGQKYLLESVKAPMAHTWVFYDEIEALLWANEINYPIVFKLRGGSGSQNVRLVPTKKLAAKLIKKAFEKGFAQYDPAGSLKERWRLYCNGQTQIKDILEGLARFIISPPYAIVKGRERGYIYFQEFIPDNDHDIRVIVIGDRAFAIKRMVRKNDFRASGSGNILYGRNLFDIDVIRLSFDLSEKLNAKCVAFDFVNKGGDHLLVEISYGFSPEPYDLCPGFWDKDLTWHEGNFDPYGWMVEDLIKTLNKNIKLEHQK